MSRAEKHSIISVLVHRLNPDDGIVFKTSNGRPGWLRVTPAVEGRLPSDNPADQRWIRLDTIVEVIPKPSFSLGDDPEEWLHTLAVVANGNTYHATQVRFRGTAVHPVTNKLLEAIAQAFTATRE